MRVIKIPKGGGKFRTIYAPDEDRKSKCREFMRSFGPLLSNDPDDVIHGFAKGRSPVTNAMQHIGYNYTLSFDLKDFFDSVTPKNIESMMKLSDEELANCFYEGAARQGLPSSPAIANLAAVPMDMEIGKLRDGGRFGKMFVYTRYADDLTFSFNFPQVEASLRKHIPEIVESFGFKVNEAKTKFQRASAGRRIVTGVAVDNHGVHPTRDMKRRQRSAHHHRSTSGALLWHNRWLGITEWCRLVIPKGYKPNESSNAAVQKVITVSKPSIANQAPQPHTEFHRVFNL